jgi:endonuclease/exonuclease/phosphatase family metal-dependent hydrolase
VDNIIDLIEREQPDCICLQEAPDSFVHNLEQLAYFSEFAFMSNYNQDGDEVQSGVIVASRFKMTTHTVYYAEVGTPEKPARVGGRSLVNKHPYLFASIEIPLEGTFCIATTHMTVTADGHADEAQTAGVTNLITLLANEVPHILCGDFNMPRGYNTNYERFLPHYTDAIPKTYGSSLDRTLHWAGKVDQSTLNAPIFDIYMVDYIFTQAAYEAHNVRLEFGVSDHAAVIADIHKV